MTDVKRGHPRITAVDSFLVAPQWLFVRILSLIHISEPTRH